MADQSASHLNPLSSLWLTLSLVRCSRVQPVCDRCKTHNIECVYPQRVKRKVTRTLTDRLSTTDGALSTILERLQRVEQHCTTLPAATSNPAPGPDAFSTPPAPTTDPPTGAVGPGPAPPRHASTSTSIPSNVSSPAPSSVAVATSPWTSIATPSASPEIDTAAILKDAVDQVQRLRLQTIATAAITEDVRIPADLSKEWIKNYFAHMQTEMFLSLVNRKLIELIPDLLELPHVHLDPAILVVYYGILYHGCALGASFVGDEESLQYVRMLYLCCLRSLPLWQREATGTTTDFIAAIFMCRTAAECFDEELSWRMYTYACDYAQKLNLHNLDAHAPDASAMPPSPSSPATTITSRQRPAGAELDADRKGFWELIQVDFFFRLLFNRPPAITSNLNSWKVNLPWLSAEAQPDMSAVPTFVFLVSSRMTFILSRFFQELETPNCTEEYMRPKTEELCREIGQLYIEWGVDEWVRKTIAADNKAEAWMMSDLAMSGYTYVIFMYRKLSVLRSSSPRPVTSDADVPDSPLAVDASRRLLATVLAVLARNPFPETISVLFGMYRLYVAYACLVGSVMRGTGVPEDVPLLERVGEAMALASRGERDFVPLVRAIQSLVVEVKRKAGEACLSNGTTPLLANILIGAGG
ncbi:fungal specific transcription factor [Colletotrichum musicola]|uniref:Fungal specific transcription factor n=1 Tax=Colletotrichum musicola TaxID=2175873 RepID=A0A8H6N776_9PEZI|nr:fungal specific transcription factor [Colletotrichum musicola]